VAPPRFVGIIAIMRLAIIGLLVFCLISAPSVSAQANVAGPWAVTLTVPRGDVDFRMFIFQKGNRLTGYMLNEMGQFDLVGEIDGQQIKFEWSIPEGGRLVLISFKGKVTGDIIEGTAKVGNVGEGPLSAERRG